MSRCYQCGLPERSQNICDRWDCPALVMGPTAERLRHGHIDSATDVLVYDKEGRPARSIAPRAVDVISRMLRNGSINAAMAGGASRFRADFHKALLHTLRAADPARVVVSGMGEIPDWAGFGGG